MRGRFLRRAGRRTGRGHSGSLGADPGRTPPIGEDVPVTNQVAS
ncbi:MAG: hypothetical protein AVDCRST_MAG34-212 [uncultured Nocardioidaceae bacterium]|uniref:Uncharacterized protein n=1 Tax=uncultured Nocardioidaceae bacterium TaxID=253824 RepID=A0A6J4LFI9_9ACTN|nr:MAG: hypothetical protein AVDCRST_MAG34-212 [uncultured Nocardioidaceae bacterium]